MRSSFVSCLSTLIAALILVSQAVSEPVQYCRFGHENGPDASVDFCVGITTYNNASSNDYDMYMTMHVTKSSAQGWNALGTGSTMAGALMFIVYGDPLSTSHEAPTVSVRTVDGYHEPQVLTQADTGGANIRLLQAHWDPVNVTDVDDSHTTSSNIASVFTAKVALVCYSCGKWPGTPINAEVTAQPWVWAWNDNQEFDDYSDNAHLEAHAHPGSSGGWGRFYVDMARSITYTPSLPPIRPGVPALGASDIPGGWDWMNPAVYIHGFLMSAAFMIFFPAGVIAIRSGSPKSFRYHWILQLLASTFVLIGTAIGLIRAHKIDSVHHYIGIIVASCSIVQIGLGWRHHAVFVRIQTRQWVSHGHIWLGRLFLLLGWANIIIGLLLAGHGRSLVSLAASFISVIALALVGWIWFVTRQREQREQRERQPGWGEEDPLFPVQATRDDYQAVAMDDDDDNESQPRHEDPGTVKTRNTNAE